MFPGLPTIWFLIACSMQKQRAINYKKRPQTHFLMMTPDPSLYLGRHDIIHMIKWTSSFYQTIKNWTVGRAGNEANVWPQKIVSFPDPRQDVCVPYRESGNKTSLGLMVILLPLFPQQEMTSHQVPVTVVLCDVSLLSVPRVMHPYSRSVCHTHQ